MVLTHNAVMLLEELLETCDIDCNDGTVDQMTVFLTALKIFDARDKVYGDTWTTYGGLNNLLRAATKVDRSMEIWWHSRDPNPLLHKGNLDDAFDAINYLAFFIRCVRSGNITGSKRARPVDPDGPAAVLDEMLDHSGSS